MGVLSLAQPLPNVAVPPASPNELELLFDGGSGVGVAVGALWLGPAVIIAARRDAQDFEELRRGDALGTGVDQRGLLVIAEPLDALGF